MRGALPRPVFLQTDKIFAGILLIGLLTDQTFRWLHRRNLMTTDNNLASNDTCDFDPANFLWSEVFPGGGHWSYKVRHGTTLRFTDLDVGANMSLLIYRADERLERLNVPDTLKAQHTAHLTTGHVLYSDMGRILASICNDTVGWHDLLCGVSDAASVRAKFAEKRYQEHRNGMHRNGKDSLLIEIGKWGPRSARSGTQH